MEGCICKRPILSHFNIKLARLILLIVMSVISMDSIVYADYPPDWKLTNDGRVGNPFPSKEGACADASTKTTEWYSYTLNWLRASVITGGTWNGTKCEIHYIRQLDGASSIFDGFYLVTHCIPGMYTPGPNADCTGDQDAICESEGKVWQASSRSCIAPPKEAGETCTNTVKRPPKSVKNPINLGVGNKYQKETDIRPATQFGLIFERHYNSMESEGSSLGQQWRSTYDRSIEHLDYENNNNDFISLYREDGKIYFFSTHDNGATWESTGSPQGALFTIQNGWEYHALNNDIETYDSNGNLITIQKQGQTITLEYSIDGLLDLVSNEVGEYLQFTYDQTTQRLVSITDNAGRVWKYIYSTTGMLEKVIFPDATPAVDTDNPVRTYHYEDVNFPNALTAITDERN